MQALATSSDAAATARGFVASDRSTSMYGSSRKRRVSTPASPGSVLTGSPLQHEALQASPLPTEPDDPTALALWWLARGSRSQPQQRYPNEHLVLYPRETRAGAARPNSLSSASSSSSTVASAALSPIVHDAMLSSKAGLRRVFHTYDHFPAQRYEFVREYEPPHARSTCSSSSSSRCPTSGGLKHQVLHAVVARDRVDGKLVVLTCLSKAIVTEWQIDHVLRVMLTLARKVGFQALLRVWDADKNWVFVQEFDAAWTCVDARFDTARGGTFSEDKLRDVVFQVVAHVHFLHAHGLSLSGELWPHDLMLKHDKVSLLFSITYLLNGYTLVAANERNKAADIAAIGMLMFQLCMVPFAPPGGVASLNISSVEHAIEDQLAHVSAPCRDTLFDCLAAKPTIDELSKRKWLRHVDFISVASKLEPCYSSSAHMRRLLYNSLLWKLAAFILVDWLDHVHSLAAIPSSVASTEDEELRQRLRKPSKRVLVGRKLLLLTGHSPHWLKRGAAIIPPLGSTILPHRDDDSDVDATGDASQLGSVFQAWTHDEIVPSSSGSGYSAFTYDFASLYSASSEPLYDAFEWIESNDGDSSAADSLESATAVATDRKVVDRTRRLSTSLLHEDVAAHALQHETLRSLQSSGSGVRRDSALASASTDAALMSTSTHSTDTASANNSSTISSSAQVPFSPEASTDPLYFSAFAPQDVAARECFRVDIWAYLRQQRAEMLETALEQNEAEVAQHVQPFHIQRGTLITVVLEASDRFGVYGDDCKTFRWRGDVSGVSFELYRKPSIWSGHSVQNGSMAQDDDGAESELCIARVIAGTKVSLLYIRLRSARPGCDSDAYSSSGGGDFALLESRLEHVRATVQEIPSRELEIVRPVGRGAFGDALLAKWHNTTDVVVKVLHRDLYRSSDAVAAFEHEAAVMHLLGKHPHVVELLGVCSNLASADAASFSLVTEYLPNGSLEDVLHGTAPPLPYQQHMGDDGDDGFTLLYDSAGSARCSSSSSQPSPLPSFGLFSRTVMARDAAHGLANIHQGHFLHRDVAARNCLVDAHFRVKVCDFGLSRALQPPSSSSSSSGFLFDDAHHGFGPLKWMAPESVLPPHIFSMQSDSYMFGVLLYEIFTGERPFPTLSMRDAIALIREGKHVPIPAGLPPTHAKLMRRCFELHPLQRPTMDQIYSTLDAWILHDTKTHAVAAI